MITANEQLVRLATDRPDEVAVVAVAPDGTESTLTRRELAGGAARTARLLQEHGVDRHSLVVLLLPNGLPWVVACYAAWWLGACVTPMSPRTPAWERDQLLTAATESGRPLTLVADTDVPGHRVVTTAELADTDRYPDDPLPRVVAQPYRAVPSGGSTGRPKIIVFDLPLEGVPGRASAIDTLSGRRPGDDVLVLGPLYHTGPFGSVNHGLFHGGRVVVMERFDAELALRLIERHRINWLFSVPAQLQRMARVEGVERFDLSSIGGLYQSGATMPPWLKQRWIELLGPTKVYEGFGSTESNGILLIRGDEWLEHPGSVGRPMISDVEIRDEDGHELPPGQVGEIHMRWLQDGSLAGSLADVRCEYWGSPSPQPDDRGFSSVGDLGWMDGEGYVHIADRRVDLVITGGVNVYPAEVETALSEHPEVDDVVVIGLADDEWGRRVHAIVESSAEPVALVDELDGHARARLAPAKVPKSYEVVTALLRADSGKVRRAALADERAGGVAGELRPR